MSVEALTVAQFEGLQRPSPQRGPSSRRALNVPREMYNFHVTPSGALYMPAAPTEVWDFEDEGEVRTIWYVETPRGLVVQMTSGKIFHISIQPPSDTAFPDPMNVTHVATMGAGEEQWPLWVNGVDGGTMMGYAPRGSAGPDGDGRTWLLEGSWDDPTVTNLTTTVTPTASASVMYKGRRFWVKRGRQVYFSELNDWTTARPEDNTFKIGGDDAGESFLTNPGFVRGMSSWEDSLVFFLGGSVWVLTGPSPETYRLRQVQTMVGNHNQNTLVRLDDGVMTYGGVNLNDPGLYLFTGDRAVKLSQAVGEYMEGSLGRITSATSVNGKYVMTIGREDVEERQLLIYDLETRKWTTFDGFVLPAVSNQSGRTLVTSGSKVYRTTDAIVPRAPGRGARVTLGYHDEDNPTGRSRYLAVKLSGRKWNGSPTVTVTANTELGETVSGPYTLTEDTFDGFVVPLHLRGTAIEIQLEIGNVADNTRVLIENLQVVTSRKGEKVSRG